MLRQLRSTVKKYVLYDLIRRNILRGELRDFQSQGDRLSLVCSDNLKLTCPLDLNVPTVQVSNIPASHTSAALTYLTRFKFPHFSPALNIDTGPIPRSSYPYFIHPQHKNTIRNLPADIRNEFSEVFRLREGDNVLELGPFIGYGTLRMSQAVGNKGRILSVEMDKDAFKLLRENLQQNAIRNVQFVNCAVSDTNTVNGVAYKKSFQANSIVKHVIKSGITEAIEHRTIENLVSSHVLKPDFMILTINGAEYKVLEACPDLLNELRPLRIIMPGWYYDNDGPIGLKIIDLLKYLRFKVAYTKGLHIFAYKN